MRNSDVVRHVMFFVSILCLTCIFELVLCHMMAVSINSIQGVMIVFVAKVLAHLNALHLTHYEHKLINLSIFEIYFKFAKQKTNLFLPEIITHVFNLIIEQRIGC